MSLTSDQLTLTRNLIADPGTSAAQRIQIDAATGGTFTITFNGQTTAAITYPAGANDVQNALSALSNIGLGNVGVNLNQGVPGTVFYDIYFTELLGNIAQPMVTVNGGSLIGTGVTVTVSQTQPGGIQAFSDDELNTTYTLANTNFFLAIAYDFDILRANASKYNRYTVGQTQEFKDQIFDHLAEMSAWYHQWAFAASQVQITGLAPVPPRLRATPIVPGQPAQALNYGPGPFGPWGKRNPWNGTQ